MRCTHTQPLLFSWDQPFECQPSMLAVLFGPLREGYYSLEAKSTQGQENLTAVGMVPDQMS